MRDDGLVVGSGLSVAASKTISSTAVRHGERVAKPADQLRRHQEEAARFGLPCGGNLRLVQEPLSDIAWVNDILARTAHATNWWRAGSIWLPAP